MNRYTVYVWGVCMRLIEYSSKHPSQLFPQSSVQKKGGGGIFDSVPIQDRCCSRTQHTTVIMEVTVKSPDTTRTCPNKEDNKMHTMVISTSPVTEMSLQDSLVLV